MRSLETPHATSLATLTKTLTVSRMPLAMIGGYARLGSDIADQIYRLIKCCQNLCTLDVRSRLAATSSDEGSDILVAISSHATLTGVRCYNLSHPATALTQGRFLDLRWLHVVTDHRGYNCVPPTAPGSQFRHLYEFVWSWLSAPQEQELVLWTNARIPCLKRFGICIAPSVHEPPLSFISRFVKSHQDTLEAVYLSDPSWRNILPTLEVEELHMPIRRDALTSSCDGFLARLNPCVKRLKLFVTLALWEDPATSRHRVRRLLQTSTRASIWDPSIITTVFRRGHSEGWTDDLKAELLLHTSGMEALHMPARDLEVFVEMLDATGEERQEYFDGWDAAVVQPLRREGSCTHLWYDARGQWVFATKIEA
jgi:hypothetical protein